MPREAGELHKKALPLPDTLATRAFLAGPSPALRSTVAVLSAVAIAAGTFDHGHLPASTPR